jgi:hypothetical protein
MAVKISSALCAHAVRRPICRRRRAEYRPSHYGMWKTCRQWPSFTIRQGVPCCGSTQDASAWERHTSVEFWVPGSRNLLILRATANALATLPGPPYSVPSSSVQCRGFRPTVPACTTKKSFPSRPAPTHLQGLHSRSYTHTIARPVTWSHK